MPYTPEPTWVSLFPGQKRPLVQIHRRRQQLDRNGVGRCLPTQNQNCRRNHDGGWKSGEGTIRIWPVQLLGAKLPALCQLLLHWEADVPWSPQCLGQCPPGLVDIDRQETKFSTAMSRKFDSPIDHDKNLTEFICQYLLACPLTSTPLQNLKRISTLEESKQITKCQDKNTQLVNQYVLFFLIVIWEWLFKK